MAPVCWITMIVARQSILSRVETGVNGNVRGERL
jgi:hypothetical protein